MHIGPSKTGTSAIQKSLATLPFETVLDILTLLQDGTPLVEINRVSATMNSMSFASFGILTGIDKVCQK